MSAARPSVAFLGPSLDAETARTICPGVELRPPVCQGDVSTVVEFLKPRAILIVDGEFGQTLSVWHKEVLAAIQAGIRVLGASSMGALRAAELDVFGMEGVGEIYRYYRDGWLTDDADVALLHADAESGYRPLTWPLVNVRATVAALARDGAFDESLAADVLDAAGRIHFSARDPSRIEGELRRSGYDASSAERVVTQLRAGYVDQKSLDARAAFEHLARLADLPPPPAERPRHLAGRGLEALLWSDVAIERRGTTLRRYQLVNDVALHHEGFAGLLERAADRYVLLETAASSGVSVGAEECAEQRRRLLARLGLTEETLDDWLTASDLDRDGFAELVEHEALVAHMRRWIVDTRLYERTRRMVIEQLQVEGRYGAAADAAARRRQLADRRAPGPYPMTEEDVLGLARRHAARSGWRPHTDLQTLADEHGFEGLAGLIVALDEADVAETARQEVRARVARALGLGGHASASSPTPPLRPGDPAWTHAVLESHQATHVLLAAVDLDLPDALAAGPRSLDDLAAMTGTVPGRLARLLRALTVLHVVRAEPTGLGDAPCWTLAPAGTALRNGLDQYARDLRAQILPAWNDLAAVIRGAEPRGVPDDEVSDRAVAASAEALGLPELLSPLLDLAEGMHVIDVGGGLGHTAQVVRDARPGVKVTVVELPETAARAAARLAEVARDIRVVAADPDDERFEPPADRVLLERVLLNLDDAAASELLRRARRSLSPGGRVDVLDIDAGWDPAAAFIDLLTMVRGGGRVRSRADWDVLAADAGLRVHHMAPVRPPFVHVTLTPTSEVGP